MLRGTSLADFTPTQPRISNEPFVRATILIGTMALAACAGPPAPTAQMAVSQAAIDEAQSAEATRYAPGELSLARDKLEQARRASLDRDNERAQQRAGQAEADAKLAAARARSARSRAAVAAIRDSIRTLREELQRASTRQQ